jgi:ATP/maltotriose-dependent transcriptional regulator MalT
MPVREEVMVAAEESAQFHRWSVMTNVDDEVLDQMTGDVAELARRCLIDAPATVFSSLLGARDDVFALIAGRQQPRHTAGLYKIAGQLCGLLSIVTFDLGHPHAATTHARTALHCAEVSGYTPLQAFVRCVQSNFAYWDGRYDEAAQLVESALLDATSGTALLRLASQQARIHAARRQPSDVSRALALAASAPTERTPDEPGMFGFDIWSAAYYASEAHCALGGTEHLDAAVGWAHAAVDELTAESRPKTLYIATARFVLASAHLARGDLDAVSEHLAPVVRSTHAEYRTMTIITRAQSLRTLLTQRTDLTSPTMTALRDDLAEFCTHPAPTPPGLEPDPTT